MHVLLAAATDLTRREDVDVLEYRDELADRLTEDLTMDIKRWKLLKSTLVSIAVLGFGTFAFLQGADPTITFIFTVSVAALVYGVELNELSAIGGLAQLKTVQIRFVPSDSDVDGDDDDGEEGEGRDVSPGPGRQSRFETER